MYDYANDNDQPAAQALNDEDAAFASALDRIDAIMCYVGEAPAGGAHLLDWEA